MKQHTHVFKCNICDAPRCILSNKQMQQATDTTSCGAFRNPRQFKMPILVQLACDEDKIEAMKNVLTQHGFQIQEKLNYPYFKLVTKDA